jgi:hypothetical protein
MALIKCEECNAKMSDKAKTCPTCGAPNKNLISENFKKGRGFFGLILYVSALLVFYYLMYQNWHIVTECGFTHPSDIIYKRLIINTFVGLVAIPFQIFGSELNNCNFFHTNELVALSRVLIGLYITLLITAALHNKSSKK